MPFLTDPLALADLLVHEGHLSLADAENFAALTRAGSRWLAEILRDASLGEWPRRP